MRYVLMIIGVLAVLFGIVWTLQGLGILNSGPMANETIWAIIGPILAVIGMLVFLFGARRGRSES